MGSRMKPRNLTLFWWAWGGLFAFYFGIGILAPWWVSFAVLWTVAPVSLLVAHRILFGRRAARRQWLILRFLIANWNRPDLIADRKLRRAKA